MSNPNYTGPGDSNNIGASLVVGAIIVVIILIIHFLGKIL